jgi:hypothetical protein
MHSQTPPKRLIQELKMTTSNYENKSAFLFLYSLVKILHHMFGS